MDDGEQIKMAFEFCRDVTLQLITLATGILALTITLCKDVIARTTPEGLKLIRRAWCTYLVSIVFGLWTLLALTGSLGTMPARETIAATQPTTAPTSAPAVSQRPTLSIYGWNARLPSFLHVIAFFTATLYVVRYGRNSLRPFASPATPEQDNQPKNPA